MSDATSALARLDADVLDDLTLRTLALQRGGALRVSDDAGRELSSRLRVFAAAMQATRANLEFSQAADSGGPGARGLRRLPWER